MSEAPATDRRLGRPPSRSSSGTWWGSLAPGKSDGISGSPTGRLTSGWGRSGHGNLMKNNKIQLNIFKTDININ